MTLKSGRVRSGLTFATSCAFLAGCGGATATLGQSTPAPSAAASSTCAPRVEDTRFLVDLAESYPVWFRAAGLIAVAPEPKGPDQAEESVSSPEDDRTRYRAVGAQQLRSQPAPLTITAPTQVTDEVLPGS